MGGGGASEPRRRRARGPRRSTPWLRQAKAPPRRCRWGRGSMAGSEQRLLGSQRSSTTAPRRLLKLGLEGSARHHLPTKDPKLEGGGDEGPFTSRSTCPLFFSLPLFRLAPPLRTATLPGSADFGWLNPFNAALHTSLRLLSAARHWVFGQERQDE